MLWVVYVLICYVYLPCFFFSFGSVEFVLLPTCVLISVVVVFVYVCVYCMSACIYVFTRCPHHPASIHHSPSPSHPSRLHCTIRHPGLSHRYSTTPSILTQIKTFAPFSLTSFCPFSFSVALLLSFHFPPSHWCVFFSEERQTKEHLFIYIYIFFLRQACYSDFAWPPRFSDSLCESVHSALRPPGISKAFRASLAPLKTSKAKKCSRPAHHDS